MSGWLKKLGNQGRRISGRAIVFILLLLCILLWLLLGLLFHFSTPERLAANAVTSLCILLLLFWIEWKKKVSKQLKGYPPLGSLINRLLPGKSKSLTSTILPLIGHRWVDCDK